MSSARTSFGRDSTPRPGRRLALVLGLLLSAAACTDQAPVEGALRIVSYNVARGYAMDLADAPVIGAALPDRLRLRRALREDPGLRGAAVFALQELCGEDGEAHVAAIADALWEDAPPSVVFHRADPFKAGACGEGNAIVSRLPMRRAGSLPLPKVGGMVRTAVWADLDLRGRHGAWDGAGDGEGIVRVWSLHLDHSATHGSATAARLQQLRAVLDATSAFRARHPAAAVVIAGDFNTLQGKEPAILAATTAGDGDLQSALPDETTTHVLGWTLDWILFAGLQPRSSGTVTLPLSDHFAIRADFDPHSDGLAKPAGSVTESSPGRRRPAADRP
ncbi:MAG: endonuclease/exonuclease/phosphatase family protein [Deltaproteobacteria bacterium]|nr:endonuclease/exonuclease/phosphatase family protein [Deltaproteobacteria bacterium]